MRTITLLLPTLGSALSLFSPPDLFSSPQFQITIGKEAILNETASSLLYDQSPSPQLHLLKTPTGQSFLCSIPTATKDLSPPILLNQTERELAQLKGLQRGLALIEPLKSNCLYHRQGWFTYSFCYGDSIRQFHEIRVPGSATSTEDPNSESYYLGKFPSPRSIAAPKYGSGSAGIGRSVKAELGGGEMMIESVSGGKEVGIENFGGQYLSMKWSEGTICDKTGLARSVDVQFHCNTQTTTRIHSIREVATCHYLLIIHTPRLCVEPVFLEGHEEEAESTLIECRPIVKKLPAYTAVDPPQPFSIFVETAEEVVEMKKQEDKEMESFPTEDVEADAENLEEASEEEEQEEFDAEDIMEEEDEYLTFLVDTDTGEIVNMDGIDVASTTETIETGADEQGMIDLAKMMQKSIEEALSREIQNDGTIPAQAMQARNNIPTPNQGFIPATVQAPAAIQARTDAITRYLKKNQLRLTELAKKAAKAGPSTGGKGELVKPLKEVGSKDVKQLVKLFSTKFEEEEEEVVRPAVRARDEL